MHGRRPAKKPLISKKNAKIRLQFAQEHLNWTVADWKKVLWSDESKFNLFNDDGKGYIRRPKNERYNPKYVTSTVKFGGGNIMIWGCFSWHGLGPLYRIVGKMDQIQYREILENNMLPYAVENLPPNWLFQHDNDPKHTARTVKQWLADRNVTVLVWPAQFPDLNPIENLWGEIQKLLTGKRYQNDDQLFEAIQNIWNNLDQHLIENLIKSMPRRCQAVIKANGYATKY